MNELDAMLCEVATLTKEFDESIATPNYKKSSDGYRSQVIATYYARLLAIQIRADIKRTKATLAEK